MDTPSLIVALRVTKDKCTTLCVQEGTVPYAGFQTWYRALGPKPPEKVRKARSFQPKEPEKLPLLILHGGPGTPSRYPAARMLHPYMLHDHKTLSAVSCVLPSLHGRCNGHVLYVLHV